MVDEPNDEEATALDLEFVENSDDPALRSAFIRGVISEPGDVDVLRLEGSAGELLSLAVGTSAYGSPLVAAGTLTDAEGTVLAEAIATTASSQIVDDLPLPADGSYFLTLESVPVNGGEETAPGSPAHTYRAGVHLRTP